MDNKSFERFELEVMKRIARENPSIEKALRRQYEEAVIVSREFTGAGFFTTFEVGDKSLQLEGIINDTFGNVQAIFEELEYGVGFALFVRGGFIEILEGYTYGELWPSEITLYELVD